MTIDLVPFADLDPALVSQALAEVTTRVQEDNPQLDIRGGVFDTLLAYYNALLGAQRQDNINTYLLARSLLAITQDPSLSDPALVDDILSNFLLTRIAGSNATGEVTVVVSDNTTVIIAAGSTWTADGIVFITPQVYTAKIDSTQINNPGDRLFTQTSDGKWAFTITVESTVEGPEANVSKNTQVVPDILPINYLTSYAASDFTGGVASETNQQLIARLQSGIACKAPSNRSNMAAMLQQTDTFAGVVNMSIIGMGDVEMVRDQHSILPISLGGRVDWYVRTQEQILRLGLIKTAILVHKDVDNYGIWQIVMGRNDAPGFYEIANIQPPSSTNVAGGYQILSDVRNMDLSGIGFVPDIDPTSVEGIYTRFQTGVIQFKDTDTPVAALDMFSTQDYAIEARCMPLIADIQDMQSSRTVKSVASDVLIKAPVPCFLQLSLVINKRAGDPDPDINAIKTALCAAVNNLGFVGKLYASQLQDVIYGYLISGQTVSPIDMLIRARYPSGQQVYRRDMEILTVPYSPDDLVTTRTAQFFLWPEDISIGVATTVIST